MQDMHTRSVVRDGQHATGVLRVLAREMPQESLQSIEERAAQIIERSVDPIGGVSQPPSNGLLYGLIQSGKTSIITVAAAMAADNAFQCIIILTTDIDLLYDQTLERIRRGLWGLNVLAKDDWKDAERFERQLRTPPFVIVCSKNGNRLGGLIDAFRHARAKGLSAIIIDDEADQASLNTYTSKGGEEISAINRGITELRTFFGVNTYLQVTATPQALFLQSPDHPYRPSFTLLSQPGPDYFGGEAFFDDENKLLRYVDIEEVDALRTSNQPSPSGGIPPGLQNALHVFLVGATAKIMKDSSPEEGYAFLCHVSVSTKDHEHIVMLIEQFKENTLNTLQHVGTPKHEKLMQDLREAYEDLAKTAKDLPDFSEIVSLKGIGFYLRGTNVKLINAKTKEEIQPDAAYNIFVGGNKLGRGITIKNLIVSYYGRNPKKPNADTVLQHARMYGYRSKTIGVTRIFLPAALAERFKLIHQMENSLRELVEKHPTGKFEGLYIPSPLRATRSNVLDPNSIGMYVAGRSYNPSYPLRTSETLENTRWIDEKLSHIGDNEGHHEVDIDLIIGLLEKCLPDPEYPIEMWDMKTIKVALKIKSLKIDKAYLVVRRGRELNTSRTESQGILSGGEEELAPKDRPTLFIYKQKSNDKGENEIWWPQLRFPEGNYVIAFSFER